MNHRVITTTDGRRVVFRNHLRGLDFVSRAGATRALVSTEADGGLLPPNFMEAMAKHDMSVDQTLMPRFERGVGPQQFIGAEAGKTEIAVEPPPGHTMLVAVQRSGVVQWFIPVNAGLLLPQQLGMTRSDMAAVPDRSLRFLVPSALIAPPADGGRTAAIDGSVESLLHFIKIPIVGDLIDAALGRILQFIIDHVDTKDEGFRRFDPSNGSPMLTDPERMALAGQRVLLLTHGIFSNVHAFNDLEGATLERLRAVYQDRIIGWEHRTVAKTPFDNADDMLTKLPPDVQPDFICHSRGGLVMRAALEHPDLHGKRETRFASVGTALFVASANQGSQLATYSHVEELLNVYSAIASLPMLGSFGVDLSVVIGLLKVLAHAAAKLPSVKALSTDADNEFVNALDLPLRTRIAQLLVARANYDPTGNPALQILNWNIDKIFGVGNDFVVPFGDAARFDQDVRADFTLSCGSEERPQSVVMHTNFFEQPEVQELIVQRFV